MVDTLKNKVSPHIQSQLPEFVQSDHPLFSLFLKYYYEFLEAGELVLSGSNDYVIDESLTQNYILDENGDNIVLESSAGKFIAGETIVGATSGFSAKVLVDDFDDNNRLFIASQQKFIVGESVVGQTSGASAPVVSYRANPVQTIQQLLAYADVDNTVYAFLDKFRDSFMESLPNTLADGIAKRKLIKNIKDMYAAKGTEDGHKLFFRILFDEEATIIYPRDSMLRVSDGQWSTDRVIRITETGTSDFNNAVGQLVTGQDSGATARIVTVIKFREGSTTIAELNLDSASVSGEFTSGEVVTTTDTTLDLEISGIAKSIVTGATVDVGGAYYSFNKPVYVTEGGGDASTARVEASGSGSIDEIMIEDGGSGYSIGDNLVFDITDTEGKDVRAKVSVVGGSFLLEPFTAPDHFLTEDGNNLVYEDSNYINQEESVGELDHLLLENGDTIILEEETFNDLGVSQEIGEITKIKMVNKGNGFVSLPTVTMSESSLGSGASLFAASTQSPMVGAINGISITNFGLDYSSVPTLTLNRNLLVKNVSGALTAGDELTSHNGTVVGFNADTQILEIKSSVTFNAGDVITTITGATATVYQSDYGQATAQIGTIGTTVGNFISDRGKVSADAMRIQDSYYYQDYSYVVRIGQSINEWRESVRRSVHPSGWNVFGEVSFASQVNASIQVPAAGSVRGFTGDTETYSPELASTFTNLFTTIFGRRLGTVTDSTQRVNAGVGVAEPSELSAGERDVTLVSSVTARMDIGRGNTSFKLGPTLENFAQYALAVHPTTTSEFIANYPDPATRRGTAGNNFSRDQYTIAQFGGYTINSVSDYQFLRTEKEQNAGDGGDYLLLEDGGRLQGEELHIPESAYTTRIGVMPPSEIIITTDGSLAINAFDNNFTSFDDGVTTFDEGDPGTRDTVGRHATSFDQGGTYGINFDQDSTTFDNGGGPVVVTLDGMANSFDESSNTFDETL